MTLAPSKVGITLPPCVVVDMDRTLALPHPERHPMDAKTCDRDGGNWPVIEAVQMYASRYPIVVVSGRQEECREPTLVEDDPPRTFAECRGWFARHDVEGIVWHHPDGRMAKLKARDFGLKRERRAQEKDHA